MLGQLGAGHGEDVGGLPGQMGDRLKTVDLGAGDCPEHSAPGDLDRCTCFQGFWEGESSCNACAPGSFGAEPGASSCTACAAGTFNSETGSTLCTGCAAGTYGAAQGANSSAGCLPCSRGSFSSEGQSVCSPCEIGTYAADPGQSICDFCAPGAYGGAAGMPVPHRECGRQGPRFTPSGLAFARTASLAGPSRTPATTWLQASARTLKRTALGIISESPGRQGSQRAVSAPLAHSRALQVAWHVSPGYAPNRPRVPRRTASGGAPHMMRRLSHSARMGPASLRAPLNATPPMMDHRPCFRDVPRPAGRLRCDACTMGTYGSSAGEASGRPLALNPEP
mmetsp:Transcript_29977/g.78970  ORF Transcript_29977/g.78970 Transcript_29977/m.78970 type:complete len:337 (-) Transcript_29977:326-1336(-)